MSRTKIVCTIGPSVNSVEKMIALMEAGMNVARLNFSHGTHEQHAETIRFLKEARRRLNLPLAIVLDTKGPEIRVGKIQGGQVVLIPGHQLMLVGDGREGNERQIPINPASVFDTIVPGMRLLFDDGYIAAHVIEVLPGEGLLVQIDDGGILKSGKGVNVPGAQLNLPAVTAKDIEDIKFGCEQDIDIIAASFVRSAEHVLEIRKLLQDQGKTEVLIFAKIENSEGIQNFDQILEVVDGIMIARGDLGVELPLSEVPILQKMMIRKCILAGKPSVTATQMLESMIYNPRPTRAEASDVANAIYDSTSAVMLSGETAVGKYPIETVKMMKSIIREAEKDFGYREFFYQYANRFSHDVPSAVTLATVNTAYSANAKAIFACTSYGTTARLLSRLRPEMPIIAMTPKEKSYHQLSLNWGVIPFFYEEVKTVDDAFEIMKNFAMERKLVSVGDIAVVTAGTPFGQPGTTNMMIVERIEDMIAGDPRS
jgi:pyruvate kinase